MIQRPLDPTAQLPLVIEPEAGAATDASALEAWCRAERATIEALLLRHGALLFRGFGLTDALSFERAALALADDLKNQYLGTSPRNARSTYTFTASELPAHYPIMQHCEMSFLPSAPTRLFFCCTEAPSCGGETPLADCRNVWRDLRPEVRDAFEARGVRIVRNYGPPGGGSRLDPWQLKGWPDVFGTTDRAEVEAIAAREGTRCEWRPDGGVRLVREQPAWIAHPETGDRIWFNHCQVFHGDAARHEYRRIARRRLQARSVGVAALLETLTAVRGVVKRPEDYATHCTYGDGTEIPSDHVAHLIDVFWDNMVFPRWRRGDLVMIDNFRVSHGRMPFRGPREILVAFTEGREITPVAA